MWHNFLCVLVLCLIPTQPVVSQWVCERDSDCSDVNDSVCSGGTCQCPTGLQLGLSGSACIALAPYHTSPCVEDHQCSRLFTMFQCRRNNQTDESGTCACQPGHHYFLGRCWPSADYGSTCSRDENCITTPREPYSLQCRGVCVCADGYYERQRGECRKIGYAVGDGCVVDEDCQFSNGVCEISSRTCADSTASTTTNPTVASPVNATVTLTAVMSAAAHGVACNPMSPCPEPLECSTFGACICPVGYYLSDSGQQCNAELGSRSTPEQCVGLLAVVVDGVCSCPPNFFYEENMRDCVRVTRVITDSCVTDENCHTFGAAARCGPGAEPWGLRTCECDTEQAVWDSARQMCRLFAGIGEQCEMDSDCLAGEFEIQCVAGRCACPEGLVAFEGLCLTTDLALGDACQATVECTETPNTVCSGGYCSCGEGYQADGDSCAAIIGGSCTADSDCVIENTVCVNETVSTRMSLDRLSDSVSDRASLASLRDSTQTCQCRDGFVAYDDVCWPVAGGVEAPCNVSLQCTSALGAASECRAGACACAAAFHHRDGSCWPVTGLFEPCSRTSQCFLQLGSERAVCRNSVCQCSFDFPYSEELGTCVGTHSSGSGASIASSATVILLALSYITLR